MVQIKVVEVILIVSFKIDNLKINTFGTNHESKKTSKLRSFMSRAFYASFFIINILYLAVALVPFLSSGSWWFIAILGLIFPFLLLLEIIFLIVWGIKKSKFVFISIVVLLLSWQQISVIFPLRGKSGENTNKPDGTIRVLSWNVSRWNLGNTNKEDQEVFRNLMLDFISEQNADILCLQEFFESHDEPLYSSTILALKKRGYTYNYFFPSYSIYEGAFEFGLAVFTKFQVVNARGYLNNTMGHSEGFCYTDLKIGSSFLRVFNFHTESPGFGKEDYNDQGGARFSKKLFSKLKNSYEFRNAQIENIREEIDKSPYPSIICGDLGDVPNSYAYFKLKGNLKDAFLNKGSGFGRTYRYISPTLRIDYQFVDKEIEIKNFYLPKIVYSDHLPLITDLWFK